MISKIFKKVICVVMCLLLCGSMTAMALKIETPETGIVAPMYANIASHSCSLVISGINSTSSATLRASKSMSLKIKMELQKKKGDVYQTIETWNASRTGTILAVEEDRLINVLANYRLKVTYTAGSETVVYFAYPKK